MYFLFAFVHNNVMSLKSEREKARNRKLNRNEMEIDQKIVFCEREKKIENEEKMWSLCYYILNSKNVYL